MPDDRNFSGRRISRGLLDRGPQLQPLHAFGFDVHVDAVEHHVGRIRAARKLNATSCGAFSQPEQLPELGGTFPLASFSLLP